MCSCLTEPEIPLLKQKFTYKSQPTWDNAKYHLWTAFGMVDLCCVHFLSLPKVSRLSLPLWWGQRTQKWQMWIEDARYESYITEGKPPAQIGDCECTLKGTDLLQSIKMRFLVIQTSQSLQSLILKDEALPRDVLHQQNLLANQAY